MAARVGLPYRPYVREIGTAIHGEKDVPGRCPAHSGPAMRGRDIHPVS
jgi:hypothetical protein